MITQLTPPAFTKSIVALSIISATALQADVATADALPLKPLVVTATSTPLETADTLSSVTVITREEINAQQAQEMSELLAAQPGVDISSNGGYGKANSVYMRGASAESTKFLLDGIPLYSATSGGAPFENIPTSLIDRVGNCTWPESDLIRR